MSDASEDDVKVGLTMKPSLFQLTRDGQEVFQAGVISPEEGKYLLSISLPLSGEDGSNEEEWVSINLDFVSSVALFTWFGHVMQALEKVTSEEQVKEALLFLEDAKRRSGMPGPNNRQARRAAQRRDHKGR